MCAGDSEQSLSEWRSRLEQVDAGLAEREHRASVHGDAAAAELAAIAKMRDEVATEWDALAARYDAWARRRDVASLGRDEEASSRDVAARRHTNDADPGFWNRGLSGQDRDHSAGDRADSDEDRRRGGAARERAGAERERAAKDRDAALDQADSQEEELGRLRRSLHGRTEIGQAIGVLMIRHNLSTDEAFELLCRRSQDSRIGVLDLAASLVAEAQPGHA